MSKRRRFGVIFCEDAEKWGGLKGGDPIFRDMFHTQPNDVWEYYSAIVDELPATDKLHEYQAFILSGSHYSVNDDNPWVHKLELFIRRVFEYHRTNKEICPKLVGICFGHQMMAKASGAKIGKNEYGKFVFGLEKITVSDDLMGLDYFREITLVDDNSFVLFASHGEEIVELPPSISTVKCVATSPRCRNEVVVYSNGCTDGVGGSAVCGLSFQGHMEITNEECLEKILPAIKAAGMFSEKDEEVLNKDLLVIKNQREEIIKVIKKFIDT